MNPFKTMFDLILFQAKPQDLPFSRYLIVIMTAGSVVSYVLVLSVIGSELMNRLGKEIAIVPLALAEHLFFALTVWLILRLRLRAARFLQTLTAMFGANTVIQLIMWPVTQWLVQSQGSGSENTPALLLLGLRIWLLAVFAHIFKEALEVRLGVGMLFTVGCWVMTSLLLLLVMDLLI